MTANPYEAPALPADAPRWPRWWMATLAVAVVVGAFGGITAGFIGGYLTGWYECDRVTRTFMEEHIR